jgi:NDP-sugar pyrophosphorylase family protein
MTFVIGVLSENRLCGSESRIQNTIFHKKSAGLHIFQILIDRICSTCIPFTVATLLIGRQYGHTSDIAIQIPGNTDPDMGIQSERLYAYEFTGYWKDVGTLSSYWEANMELIDIVPEFNLYEEYWKIYTKSEIQPPDYIAGDSVVERSIIGEGSDIYGEVYNSVIGCGVTIGKGTVIRDSIIMNQTQIGEGCEINKAIIAENVVVGNQVKLGVGEETENDTAPHIYNHGLVTIGEKSVIPDGISVGKNSVISGVTAAADYEDSQLASGKTLIKAGE